MESNIPFWLDRIINNGVGEGERNKTRFKIIINLVNLGFDEKFIFQKVLEFNSRCRPPENMRNVEYHFNYTIGRLENER